MRVPVRVPSLGLDEPIRLSLWLVAPGESVLQGERIVELLCGPVVVDLPAPASGTLEQILVPEDHPVRQGQVLGFLAQAHSCCQDHSGPREAEQP